MSESEAMAVVTSQGASTWMPPSFGIFGCLVGGLCSYAGHILLVCVVEN